MDCRCQSQQPRPNRSRLGDAAASCRREQAEPLMPIRPLTQSSFLYPEFACPGCIVPGTVAWLLARKRSMLFPAWLFRGWRGGGRGRNAWPAAVLMTLVLLRWTEEGMSRRASVRRARTDAQWRAAMGVRLDSAVPSERTLRDFERFLRGRHPEVGESRHLLFRREPYLGTRRA